MRKQLLLLALGVSVLTGCDKFKNLAQFTFSAPYDATVDMPVVASDSVILPAKDTVIDIPLTYATDIDAVLSNKNTNGEKLVAVELKELSMSISNPSSQNFDFLDTVRVYLHGPNLPEMLVARKWGIAPGATKVEMDTTGIPLKAYLLQDSVRIRLNARVHGLPAKGTKMDLNSVFRVTANPMK